MTISLIPIKVNEPLSLYIRGHGQDSWANYKHEVDIIVQARM